MNYIICNADSQTFIDLQGCFLVIGRPGRFAIAIKDYNELPAYIAECVTVVE